LQTQPSIHENGQPEQIALTFLHWLYGDEAPGWLPISTFDHQPTQWFSAHQLDQVATYCQAIARRYNCYFGLGLRQEQLTDGRGEAADILGSPGFWIELDIKHPVHKKVNLPETIDEAISLVREAIPLEPSLIIGSGYGIHVHWLFRELWIFEDGDDRQRAYHLLHRLQATIQSVAKLYGWEVDSTFDLSRVLRLPGTYNRKIPDDPKLVTIIEAHEEQRYNPGDFTEHLIEADETTYQQTTGEAYAGELPPIDLQSLKIHPWLKYLIRVGTDPDYKGKHPSRSEAHGDATEELLKAGVDERTILSLLLDPQNAISERPREKGRTWLAADIARIRGKLNGHRPTATNTLAPETSEAQGDERNASEVRDDQQDTPKTPPIDNPSVKTFFRKKTFIPKRLADYLLTQHHIKYAAGMLWVYRNGVYVSEGERILTWAGQQLFGDERRQNRIEETLRYIEVETYAEMPPPDLTLINLLNGRLEWATDTVHPHNPDVFTVIQLPINYDPHATCPTFDGYLDTTLDEEMIPLVEEIIGYLLTPDTRYEKAVMLTGDGENGKSVFIDTLTALLGSQHVSNVALQDLEENRFRLAELFGKLGNFFADLDPRALKSSSIFKTLVTGDEIEAEHKFKDPFKFRNVARLVFSANKLPASSDRTHAFYRRWHVIPFTRTFTEETRDTDLRAKLVCELPGILNRALRGLKRLSAQKGFTVPQAVKDALSAYERQNDSLATFLEEAVDRGPTLSVTKQRFYQRYCRWCDLYRLRPVSQKELSPRLYKLVPDLDEARLDGQGIRRNKGPWRWIGIKPIDDGPEENEG